MPAACEMLQRQLKLEQALEQSQKAIAELKNLIDEITRPPLHVAGVVAVNDGRCLVALGHARA